MTAHIESQGGVSVPAQPCGGQATPRTIDRKVTRRNGEKNGPAGARPVGHWRAHGIFWGHDGRWVRLARSSVEGAAACLCTWHRWPANGIAAIRAIRHKLTRPLSAHKMHLGKEQPAGKEVVGLVSQGIKGSEEGVVGWTARGRTRAVRAEEELRRPTRGLVHPFCAHPVSCRMDDHMGRGGSKHASESEEGRADRATASTGLSRIGSRNQHPGKRGKGGQRV